MKNRGPFKPVIPAAIVYLVISVPGIVLIVDDHGTVGGGVLLVGALWAGLFSRWYNRKNFG